MPTFVGMRGGVGWGGGIGMGPWHGGHFFRTFTLGHSLSELWRKGITPGWGCSRLGKKQYAINTRGENGGKDPARILRTGGKDLASFVGIDIFFELSGGNWFS